MKRWPPVSDLSAPYRHFLFLALSRFGKALQNITDFSSFFGFLAKFDVFSSIFVVSIVLRTVWYTKIIFFAMSSTEIVKNAKFRGHASCTKRFRRVGRFSPERRFTVLTIGESVFSPFNTRHRIYRSPCSSTSSSIGPSTIAENAGFYRDVRFS